ncbi:MAG: hypothetical protein GF411_18090 [Candidatus Lokiarchaeota archaeon]|nr:hypothetical protein [Candidatus Lokiarchaeota archaeon]
MQLEWLIAALGVIGTIAIIGFVVAFLIYGFCLGLALGPVHGRNRDLGSTFVTAFIIALTYLILLLPGGIFIFCLAIILQWYVIKSRHDVGWGGAIVAWIITIIIVIVVVILLALLLGLAIFSALPLIPGP